ncbi:MAG: CDP-glycerol glycerophosphotransferase family protein, partial [Candidatus Nanopelagicales bacterium]
VGRDWCSSHVVADKVDQEQGLVRVMHRHVGTPPEVEYLVDGVSTPPRHGKVRSIDYVDRTVMHERIAWVSCRGTLSVRLKGDLVPIRDWWDEAVPLARNTQAPTSARDLVRCAARRVARTSLRGPGRGVVSGPGHDFRGAWVLVDRIRNADDSAEVLFRHLRSNRPDINAWFTVERGTPDWDRLLRDGYGDRLVAWGGVRWYALMANCNYLISSHANVPIHQPRQIVRLVEPHWKSVFLQHGIIKDDLSNWLNPKDFSLFVTSTAAEFASVAGDDTRYVYTTSEVCNTGLPRFDRLIEVGAQFPPEDRDLVLVAPTWRHWLTTEDAAQRRTVNPDFWATDYARNWMGFLRSDRLARVVQDRGLRLAFLPHPDLQEVLDSADLPSHVTALRFAGQDVRRYFARAAAVTTDYSSMAFNAAYLERPVTYFQFDADLMFGGGHIGRGGYFKYDRDGLGPVAYDLEAAVDDLVGVLEHGRQPQPKYLERIRATFPQRDGHACERAIAAIEALGRPLTAEELRTPVATPTPSAG